MVVIYQLLQQEELTECKSGIAKAAGAKADVYYSLLLFCATFEPGVE